MSTILHLLDQYITHEILNTLVMFQGIGSFYAACQDVNFPFVRIAVYAWRCNPYWHDPLTAIRIRFSTLCVVSPPKYVKYSTISESVFICIFNGSLIYVDDCHSILLALIYRDDSDGVLRQAAMLGGRYSTALGLQNDRNQQITWFQAQNKIMYSFTILWVYIHIRFL